MNSTMQNRVLSHLCDYIDLLTGQDNSPMVTMVTPTKEIRTSVVDESTIVFRADVVNNALCVNLREGAISELSRIKSVSVSMSGKDEHYHLTFEDQKMKQGCRGEDYIDNN